MSKNVRVGIFVALALIVSGIFVFMIGDNRRLWESKARFNATFNDVAGLRPGAPVRMGGVEIGAVGDVGHSGTTSDTRIHVTLNLVRDEVDRIRLDPDVTEEEAKKHPDRPRGTIARVVNKGLLGDKMIELTVGDMRLPKAPEGTELRTEDPVDLTKYLAKFDSLSEKADRALGNIERITGALANEKVADDIKGSISSINVLLAAFAREDGAAHRLLFNPDEAKKVDALLNNLLVISHEAAGATADVHTMTSRVNSGPGLAHALLYDEKMAQGATGTLVEVRNTLEAVRTQPGIAHAVVYGDPNTQKVLVNVGAMSDDLRAVMAGVRAGKGTIGGLLVDPSIYEDLKAIVGNVERNQVLRALVRYSIKETDQRPHAAPPAAPVTPPVSQPAGAKPEESK
jgi:phospholipid/cholesterol/gamma-HCH transport system substrate-binding protein